MPLNNRTTEDLTVEFVHIPFLCVLSRLPNPSRHRRSLIESNVNFSGWKSIGRASILKAFGLSNCAAYSSGVGMFVIEV